MKGPKRKDPIIRLASREDLPTILPLFRAYQKHYGQLTAAGKEQTRRFLAEQLGDPAAGFCLLAFDNHEAVGFALAYLTVSGLIAQRIAHLGDLYVAPQHRRNGIATALFEAVVREAGARGIPLVRWLSLNTNIDLNQWYNRLVKSAGTFEL